MSVIIAYPLYRNSVSVVVISYDTQYIYYTDGIAYYRKGVRDYSFIIDKTLTPTGFSGSENTDWENIYELS